MGEQVATLLFADIVGSTKLYDQFGDARARELVGGAIAEIRRIVTDHGGEVLHEIGDEVGCRFQDTTEAAAAACAIHGRMHESLGAVDDTAAMPLTRVRVGLHRGMVYEKEDVLIGETAKVARWASSNAKADQTLATRAVIDALPDMYRAVSRFVDDETWNFVSLEHIEIFEIIWDVEAITACPGEMPPTTQTAYRRIAFRHDRTEIELDEARPVLSVGRDVQNDLVIRDDLVSRHHFSAQFSRGRCTLTDNSTNGTYVILDGETSVAVRRETYPLRGTGVIYLGEPSPAKTPIEFTCH